MTDTSSLASTRMSEGSLSRLRTTVGSLTADLLLPETGEERTVTFVRGRTVTWIPDSKSVEGYYLRPDGGSEASSSVRVKGSGVDGHLSTTSGEIPKGGPRPWGHKEERCSGSVVCYGVETGVETDGGDLPSVSRNSE